MICNMAFAYSDADPWGVGHAAATARMLGLRLGYHLAARPGIDPTISPDERVRRLRVGLHGLDLTTGEARWTAHLLGLVTQFGMLLDRVPASQRIDLAEGFVEGAADATSDGCCIVALARKFANDMLYDYPVGHA